jgi:hypothetical protein
MRLVSAVDRSRRAATSRAFNSPSKDTPAKSPERAAVQGNRGADREHGRQAQFRASGRQIEKLDGMALSIDQEEGREGHRDARGRPPIRIRIAFLGGGCGACHRVANGGSNIEGAARV